MRLSSVYLIGKTVGGAGQSSKRLGVQFGHIKFEIQIRYQNIAVEQAAEYMRLKVKGKAQAGDTHLGIVGVCMVQITQEVGAYRQKKSKTNLGEL